MVSKAAMLWVTLPLSCLLVFGGVAILIAGSVLLAEDIENICDYTDDGLDCCDTEAVNSDCPSFDCGFMETGGSDACHCTDQFGNIVCKDHKSLARGIAMVVIGGLCFLCCPPVLCVSIIMCVRIRKRDGGTP
ncbi:hypothetical protein QOT17_003982 [Balamuthia mandrillaris]